MTRKSTFIISAIVAVTLICGCLFLNALSNRYAVIESNCVLDKWTGKVTGEGYFLYNIHKPSGRY